MKAFEIRKATLGKFALAITGLSLLVAQAMSISPAWADGGLGEAPDLEKPPAEVQDSDGNGNPFDDGGGFGGSIYESHDGFTWHRTNFIEAGNGGYWDKIKNGD
jgi:hypothetical protein